MADARLVVMVLSLDREPWRTLERTQRETWGSVSRDVPTIFLQGAASGPRRSVVLGVRRIADTVGLAPRWDQAWGRWAAKAPARLEGDILRTSVPETWIGTNAKTRVGLRAALDSFDFDYLLRTNSSTYVACDRALSFVQSLPRTGYYGGHLLDDQMFVRGLTHAKGTGILMSRDVVEVVSADPLWDYYGTDEIGIASSARRAGILPTPITQIELRTAEALDSFRLADADGCFLFRCRGARDGVHDVDRCHDVRAMRYVHALLTGGPPAPGIG